MDQLRSQDTTVCSFVAVALRIAQSMGLHDEDVNASLDRISAEERRRLWSLVVHVDMVTARKAGLAPLISQQSSTSPPRLLTEWRDNYIGAGISATPHMICPGYVLAKGRHEAAICSKILYARQIDQRQVSISDIRKYEHGLAALRLNLEDRVERIRNMEMNDILPYNPTADGEVSYHMFCLLQSGSDAYKLWAEATLGYTVSQTYCELYSLALRDVDLWDQVRDMCVALAPFCANN
jgi:hypothetical protein